MRMQVRSSLIRDEEYRRLSELILEGKIIDLGGSKGLVYQSLIKGKNSFFSVNIDKTRDCDLIMDLQKKFPLEDESFDHAISLNVLEHVYDFHNVIKETYRIIKPTGSFVFATPFMFENHSSPDDFFRYTKSCLKRMLSDEGFVDIKIDEMGYGVFSLVFQTIGGAMPGIILRQGAKKMCVGIDRALGKVSGGYRNLQKRIPIGYFVVARKPEITSST